MQRSLVGGKNVSQILNRLLTALRDTDSEDKAEILDKLFEESQNIIGLGYIGNKSFSMPREIRKSEKTAPVAAKQIPEETMQQAINDFLKDDPYSAKKAAEYFDDILGNREKMTVAECGLDSKESVNLLMSLISAADTSNYPFKVKTLPGTVETGAAYIRNIEIEREGNSHGYSH